MDNEVVHIERSSRNDWESDDAFIYEMWCGEKCLIFDDGEPIPDGFDFVFENNVDSATCIACKNKHTKHYAKKLKCKVPA